MQSVFIFMFMFLSFFFVSSQSTLFFDSNKLLDIVNKNESLCHNTYYELVEKEYICIYKNNISYDVYSIHEDFFSKVTNIYIESFVNDNDIIELYLDNYEMINYIKYRFFSFYSSIIKPLKQVFSNVIRYYFSKIEIFIAKLMVLVEINTTTEEIILPINTNGRIRYFTNITLDKYDNCLDFLQSLNNSVCFVTNREIIKSLFI